MRSFNSLPNKAPGSPPSPPDIRACDKDKFLCHISISFFPFICDDHVRLGRHQVLVEAEIPGDRLRDCELSPGRRLSACFLSSAHSSHLSFSHFFGGLWFPRGRLVRASPARKAFPRSPHRHSPRLRLFYHRRLLSGPPQRCVSAHSPKHLRSSRNLSKHPRPNHPRIRPRQSRI